MPRRTKIVTTLGPATDRDGILEGIIRAGADMVRMNFSHGTPEDHIQRANQVREIAAKLGRHVAIMGTCKVPRSASPPSRMARSTSPSVTSSSSTPPSAREKVARSRSASTTRACQTTSYQAISCCWTMAGYAKSGTGGRHPHPHHGHSGRSALQQQGHQQEGAASPHRPDRQGQGRHQDCRPHERGLPGGLLPRSGDDLRYARELAREAGSNAKIVAKVERAETVASDEAMEDIILGSDAVMVAQGDLGVGSVIPSWWVCRRSSFATPAV